MKLLYSVIKCAVSISAIYMIMTVRLFACTPLGSNAFNHFYNAPAGSITVPRDAPTGSTVLTQSVNTGLAYNDYFAYCTTGDTGRWLLQGGELVSGQIYKTNVPGIGITIRTGDPSIYYTNPSYDISNGYAYNWAWSNWGTSFQITYIKTGPVTSGNITGTKAIFSITGLGNLLTLSVDSISVIGLACSINTPQINVPLGNVFLPSFTGVGVTPKSYDFNVGLNCDANANINVSLGGTQSTETSNTSVLALTDAGGENVATGVGVQIIYNGTPLKLNENIVLKKSGGGQELLPFTARYYQTKAKVTTGSANATATLYITYQ